MALAEKALRTSDILHALEHADELRTIPTVLQKILAQITEPEASIEEIADLVVKDSVLSAKVLQLANSPYIGLSREICSLKQAIVLLGMRRIRNLVLTTLLIQQFPLRGVELPPWHFWAHALGTAQGASLLNLEKNRFTDELYYTAGLLHDIGEIALAQYFPDEFSFVYQMACEKQMGLYQAEMEVLGISHCEIGALLAEKWSFPEPLREVLAFHHTPERAENFPVLVAAVNFTDIFTQMYGLNYGIYQPMMISVEQLKSFQILKANHPEAMARDWEAFSLELMDRFQKIAESVKGLFNE